MLVPVDGACGSGVARGPGFGGSDRGDQRQVASTDGSSTHMKN